jgi:hypothetical protein
MRWSSLILHFGMLGLLIQSIVAKPLSVSPEGTFSFNGRQSITAKQFSRRLDGLEKEFAEVTGYRPSEAPPVIIVLHPHDDRLQGRALLRMDTVEGGIPKIQVDVAEENLSSSAVATVVAQAMLLRRYYNGKSPDPGSRIVEFPSWLIHGLGKLSDPEAKQAVIPISYIKGGTPPTIADLLIQKAPPEGNSVLLDIYDTMAAALLSAGLKNQGGDQTLRAWIGEFNPNDPKRSPSYWPPGWSMELVERRWLLLMAGNSAENETVSSLLSVKEVLARYDAALSEIATPNHSLALLKKQKGADYLVGQLSTRLIALRLRANPLTDSLLDETIQLCLKFKHLSQKKIAEREKELTFIRDKLQKNSQAIEAYLDWYEAAKIPLRSGIFDKLLNTKESSIQKGPVGHYLDVIEQRGW